MAQFLPAIFFIPLVHVNKANIMCVVPAEPGASACEDHGSVIAHGLQFEKPDPTGKEIYEFYSGGPCTWLQRRGAGLPNLMPVCAMVRHARQTNNYSARMVTDEQRSPSHSLPVMLVSSLPIWLPSRFSPTSLASTT